MSYGRSHLAAARAAVLAALAAAGCGGSRVVSGAVPATGAPAVAAVPPRPALPPGSDTCDPFAYYRFGRSALDDHPAAAAAAFYWMQRLAPANPLGYYAERVALLMADKRLMRGYLEEDDRTLASDRVRQIDSLLVRAIMLDPFFARAEDENLLMAYLVLKIGNDIRSQATPTQFVSDAEIRAYIQEWVEESADSTTRGWYAFARSEYRDAAAYWVPELRRHPRDTHLRARRAQALFLAGDLDSARVELDTALADARRADAQRMRYAYDSKVLWEYERGRIRERQNDGAGARQAYEAALVEDISFYPAHIRLGYVAARAGDTATAITELERALQIRDDDFSARLYLGLLQSARGAYGPAAQELQRAAEVEPWVALTHYALADARRKGGDRDGAAAEYRRYLALAARTDPNLADARQRLVELAAPPAAPPSPR